VEVEEVEEWEVEKILNKKKMRGVEKYLVQWKGFTAEGDTWERRENLKNVEELIKEFEQGGVEVRRQEKVERKKEVDEYKRMELPGKYTTKFLYKWDDKKFEDEYLKKLEKNWKRWKEDRQIDESKYLKMIEENMEEENEKIRRRDWRIGHFSRGEILKGGNVNIEEGRLDLCYFSFHFLFSFRFIPLFSIFRTTSVRVDWSCCHTSHLMAKSQDRSQDLGEFSRRFENK